MRNKLNQPKRGLIRLSRESHRATRTVANLLVGKGSKAAYIPKSLSGRQEWEVVIQRGSSFKVREVKGNNIVLELE